MPPRSTKAPNSAMFLTTPLRIWPGSISVSSFFFISLALVLEQLAAADDDVAPRLVDLEDLALDGLVDVVGDVGRPANVHLAGRQEDVDADVDEQAALDLAGDQAGDDVAFLVLGDDVFPFLLPLGLAIAQDDGAVLVLDGVEQHLNLVADLRRDDLVVALVVPFAAGR